MKRVEAASGAKYSVQKEAPRKAEPIAPPRSSYTPVGKVDIAALKRSVPPAPKPAPPPAARPTASAASLYGRPTASTSSSAPSGAWPEEKPAAPPLPTASRPPTLPTASRPAFSAMVCHLTPLLCYVAYLGPSDRPSAQLLRPHLLHLHRLALLPRPLHRLLLHQHPLPRLSLQERIRSSH
jgi:hypothetical protein